MNLAEWIFPAILVGGAFAAAVAVIAALGLSFGIDRRYGTLTLAVIPVLMCLGITVGTLTSGRSLRLAGLSLAGMSAGGGGGASFQRLITGAILALCAAKIISAFWRKERWAIVGVDGAVFCSFICYFVVLNLLGPLIAEQSIGHNALYSAAVFSAVFVVRRDGGAGALLSGVRTALLLLVVADLLLAAVKPDMALQAASGLTLPGLPSRLWGVEAHPNGAGGSALVLLILLKIRPSRLKPLNWLGWTCGLAVLLLAQSKTIWAISLPVALVLAYYAAGRDEQGRFRTWFVLAVLFGLFSLLGFLAFSDVERILQKYLLSREIAQLETATGRLEIWRAAVEMWMSNPMLGFGPDAWGPVQRMKLGMPFALHAHNQALHVLSTGGAVAGLAFAFYIAAMVVASIRSAHATSGASLAMAVFYVSPFDD